MRAAGSRSPRTTAALASVSSTATTATRGSVAMAASADDLEMIPGVRRLAETKRVWLLDQFGVLHDGVTAYPGAVDAARRLHESGAKLYVISNSSRRSTNTLQKLAPMGFDPSWFSGVVTSGEVTHQMLASRGKGSTGDGEESDSDDEFWASLGKKCVHFTWSTRGAIPLDGLDLETVTDPEEADFLLAHGTEAANGAGTNDEQRAAGCVDTPLEDMRKVLERAAARNLPLIVANPDVVTVGGDAGAPDARHTRQVVRRDTTNHGVVRLMGKPDRIIYDRVLEMTGLEASRGLAEEAIAVGDSLEHANVGGGGWARERASRRPRCWRRRGARLRVREPTGTRAYWHPREGSLGCDLGGVRLRSNNPAVKRLGTGAASRRRTGRRCWRRRRSTIASPTTRCRCSCGEREGYRVSGGSEPTGTSKPLEGAPFASYRHSRLDIIPRVFTHRAAFHSDVWGGLHVMDCAIRLVRGKSQPRPRSSSLTAGLNSSKSV